MRGLRATTTAVLLLAVVSALAGCGDQADDGDGGGSGDTGDSGGSGSGEADLRGTYVADRVDSTTYTMVPGSTITLTFEDGNVTVRAGCNTMFGGASVEDGRLVVSTMGGTEMACEQPLMDQDTWMSEFLTSSPAVAVEGDTLTLTGNDATIELAGESTKDVPLEDTMWRLDTVITGGGENGAASSVPQDARDPMLRIRNGVAGWDAVFSTGCNQGSSPVEVGDEVLSFGAPVLTRMMCHGAVGELEKTFLGVLGPGTTYTIEGDRLTLTAADGKSGLGFTAR